MTDIDFGFLKLVLVWILLFGSWFFPSKPYI